ncbi:MAG TPA: ABC transporter permease [Pyrinomonadaceae bacterium]|nr:ABC transporter permease [Pyrinomonadaceae bacterium]
MFLRVLSTEILKLKRTLALWMILVSPLLVVLLEFVIIAKGTRVSIPAGKDVWPVMVKQAVEVWTLLMMPMFLTLETSLLAGLEHTGNSWKSLLALPAPRWTIYVSKLMVTICMLWVAHAVLVGGIVGSGALLKFIYPNLNLGSMPLQPFVAPMVRVSVSALLAVAIQHWVSLRWHSYPVAIGFGMSVMLIGIFTVQSKAIGSWFPWSLPIHAVLDGATGQNRIIVTAVAGAVVAAMLGCWQFVRREIG